jgi:hypothetical protein
MAFSPPSNVKKLLALFCSAIARDLLPLLAPSLSFTSREVASLPFTEAIDGEVESLANEAIAIAKEDWDSSELSWDFGHLPFLWSANGMVADAWEQWVERCGRNITRMKQIEAKNNLLFISSLGLQGEISDEAPEDQITLYRPDREEDIKRLLSYAVGCMMGRYSLDRSGLIYAHSGNKDFDPSQYKTFRADLHGIIPLTDFEWFDNDTAKRFEEFIATAWPKELLEENLKFVAESLGFKSGEPSRATIRRYLATGFYKHHLSMYKRRPIYWLFSSGKQRAFQALVYLHRYSEGTLSRIRTEYVVPLLGKMSAGIGHLDRDITGATGKHRRDLEREQATLRKQLAELQKYDDTLRSYTDQRIALDLDDGVKVNYAKFGDLLAEVKAVTGGSDEE